MSGHDSSSIALIHSAARVCRTPAETTLAAQLLSARFGWSEKAVPMWRTTLVMMGAPK